MNRSPSSILPLICLVLVVAWGAWLRLADLGGPAFGTDEMNHLYVGQSLAAGEGPYLPSGNHYGRGLDYSRMVSLSLPRMEDAEAAVRLPAAVLGIVGLVLIAAIAWSMAGPWAAVVAALLLAIYPEGLRLSRYGRFYTLQLVACLVALFAGWRLLGRNRGDPSPARSFLAAWGWAVLAALALLYAARVQVVTLSVAVGFGAAVAAVGIHDLRGMGRQAWRWSVPWQLTVLGTAGAVIFLAARHEMAGELLAQARSVPMWARLSHESGGPVTAYYRALSSVFPLLVSLSPLTFLVCFLRAPRAGTLLLGWFAVPVLLHSFVFAWKAERYILAAVPALLIASAIAAAIGGAAFFRFLERELGRWTTTPRPWAGTLTACIAFGTIITTPAFNISRRRVETPPSNGWMESARLLAARPELQNLPLGSATPLPALYYWGRLDFVVQPALLESWTRDTLGPDSTPFLMKEMGAPDVYAGKPVLTTPEAIRDRFGPNAVLIGVDQKYFTFNNIDPGLARALQEQATELCESRCGSLRLFLWRPPG